MFAELVINIEAALQGTFHYDVPSDLRPFLQIGHLVEVEFGRRLAQGIVIGFTKEAPIDDTKPIIALVNDDPVVLPWQIELAQWMSVQYLAPLNGCLRLMLPPGLTRWADVTLDVNPYWDGNGRLTEAQEALIELLRERGDLRGRQVQRAVRKKEAFKKSDWKTVANQLVKRDILRRASVLDPPRMKPKKIRTAELSASWQRVRQVAAQLGRSNKQADVLDYLAALDDPLPEAAAVFTATHATAQHLEALAGAGLIQRDGEFVTLAIPHTAVLEQAMNLRQAGKYHQILTLLAQAAQPVNISDIYAQTESTITHLRKLAALDLIRFGDEEVWRDPLADRDFMPAEQPMLTADQARVWGRLKVEMMTVEEEMGEEGGAKREESSHALRPTPFLLHGVTGSGKTEIYMRAIDFAVARGQQAVVLVPEIALTPQTVRRFAARFPGRVAVLHSRLSEGERYDTWRRARQGLFDIVVGPRSALFTPFPHLGVIVLDEEHDPSYKQTPPVPPPYYHARETAVALSQITQATLIMGSATPDVVTYHRAQGGRFHLLELPKRVMGHRQRIHSQELRLQIASHYRQEAHDPDDALTIPLPPIQVVDLRQELRAGNRSIFSRALANAITETLDRGEQAILFLNRRGTATFVMCRDCGHVLRCPRCDMPLTYHRPHLMLACHHCGRSEPQQQECPQCGSRRIKYFGLGTEQVETLVQQQWPQARITRWDRDTTAGRNTHETLLASFINQEADILVGTQMIAKGLDLPLVTLVGVISADVSLGLPDYRTGERAFQILAQVAGRAGRGLLGGRVILQTYQPEHYAVVAAAEHDFASFYIEEIRFRTKHSYPPFRRMAKLVLVDPVNERGQREAEKLAKGLRLHIREMALGATEILGPMPPFFNRIDGRYRWQIIIRSPDPVRLLTDFPLPPNWIVDIDPVSTL
ncbi:MAG: primosomal protein N' [Ardenticatenaceae bacterium]|nr:primosomal protein N' [Ardenticatenaceae bacterium]